MPDETVIAVGVPTVAFMVIFVPLLEPVRDGVLEITLIRYPEPVTVPPGIVADIVPAAVEVTVPIFVGVVKLPVESDN